MSALVRGEYVQDPPPGLRRVRTYTIEEPADAAGIYVLPPEAEHIDVDAGGGVLIAWDPARDSAPVWWAPNDWGPEAGGGVCDPSWQPTVFQGSDVHVFGLGVVYDWLRGQAG